MIVEQVEVPGATLWTASEGAGRALVLCHGGPGLHGAHDEPARAREVAELALRGRWAELEHSSHVPWFEEPARLRELPRAAIIDPCLS